MTEEDRPVPEELLEAVAHEAGQSIGGHLKIFLGMAAGVGKTYAMLQEAQELRHDGVHVVVGVVATHGRQETEELLAGLETVPLKTVQYRDKELQEMDVDAIIKLQPDVVLVDELAHHNAPGVKHEKRWQDVVEILEAGIDVYTTLNVQHIESLNDIVKGITEITVRETVPDMIVEKAASIQLIDLTPKELLERLKEGKVYLGEQSRVAAEHFFLSDRLTALREIALRYAADKVDSDLRRMVTVAGTRTAWKPREKILVAISHSPHTIKLIRTTRRLATSMNAPWIAVYVQTGTSLDEVQKAALSKNLSLARELGAEVITIHDPSVADGIKRIADQRGVTQIILGRPPSQPFLFVFKRASLVDRLSAECRDIDIHIIRQESNIPARQNGWFHFSWRDKLNDYLLASAFVCILALANWLVLPMIGYKIVGVVFLIGILVLSLFFKKGPILLATLLYAAIWGIIFIPPTMTLTVALSEDLALLVLYVLTGITVAILVDRAREQREALQDSERTTLALYEIVRFFTSHPSEKELSAFIKEKLSRILQGDVSCLIRRKNEELIMDSIPWITDPKEKSAAIWSFESGKEAGWSTDTLPSASNLYVPLKGIQETVGVIVYHPHPNTSLTLGQKTFLNSVSQQIANYVERTFALERSKQHDNLEFVERVNKSILERISRTLEGPILATRAAIAQLKAKIGVMRRGDHLPEVGNIESTFEAFIKILTNFSAIAQLSEGMVPLKEHAHSVREFLQDCCDHLRNVSGELNLNVQVDERLPNVTFDYHLVQMLVFILILNAIERSPPNTAIRVEAKQVRDSLLIAISDVGENLPQAELDAIFEGLIQVAGDLFAGTSSGLVVAKTIAEIHKGSLTVENLPDKGLCFSLHLPIELK